MRDFYAATYGVLVNDPGVAAIVGTRLYENEAPQKPVFPYAVYVKVSNSSVMRGIQQIRLQVNIVDDKKNSEKVLTALDAVENAFLSAQRYTVYGSSNAVVLRRHEKFDNEILNDEGESFGWSGVIDFDILYSK